MGAWSRRQGPAGPPDHKANTGNGRRAEPGPLANGALGNQAQRESWWVKVRKVTRRAGPKGDSPGPLWPGRFVVTPGGTTPFFRLSRRCDRCSGFEWNALLPTRHLPMLVLGGDYTGNVAPESTSPCWAFNGWVSIRRSFAVRSPARMSEGTRSHACLPGGLSDLPTRRWPAPNPLYWHLRAEAHRGRRGRRRFGACAPANNFTVGTAQAKILLHRPLAFDVLRTGNP